MTLGFMCIYIFYIYIYIYIYVCVCVCVCVCVYKIHVKPVEHRPEAEHVIDDRVIRVS